MFWSEKYHNFQTTRKQKTLPATAGFRNRDLRVSRSTFYQLSYTVRTDQRLDIMNYILISIFAQVIIGKAD